MMIMTDIQDTLVMQKKLSSLLRRSNTFGMSKSDMQVELDMIISDLISNVNRIEKEMKTPCLVDLRNIYDLDEMKNKNFRYVSIGRPAIDNLKLVSAVA